MANITTSEYKTDKLIAGPVVTGTKQAVIDTYYRGMLLGRVDATGVYGAYDATGTYDVLNETSIPNGATIVVNATVAGTPGTAVLSGDVLYVNSTTDQTTAETARDAVAGLEKIQGVVVADRTLAAQGALEVYLTGSQLSEAGIVDDAGDPLTVTSAIIELAQDSNIVIKEA